MIRVRRKLDLPAKFLLNYIVYINNEKLTWNVGYIDIFQTKLILYLSLLMVIYSFLSLIRMIYFNLSLIRIIYYLSNDIINDLFFIYYYSAKKGLSYKSFSYLILFKKIIIVFKKDIPSALPRRAILPPSSPSSSSSFPPFNSNIPYKP